MNTKTTTNNTKKVLPLSSYKTDFINKMNSPKTRISTGLKDLDIFFNGGFTEGIYALAAESSSGKSALMQFFAQSIAKNGDLVLYFTTEMAAHEFIGRGISYTSYVENSLDSSKPKYTISDILGYSYNKDLDDFFHVRPEQYMEYYEKWFDNYSENFNIVTDGINGISSNDIVETTKNFIDSNKNRSIVVFVDYLQLIKANEDQPQNDRKNKLDNTIKALKGLSMDFHLPIFVASSIGRASYGAEKIGMGAFKESGDIEYTSDVCLGWASDQNSPDNGVYRTMNLDILKYRNGIKGARQKIYYFPAYNYFTMKKPKTTQESGSNIVFV